MAIKTKSIIETRYGRYLPLGFFIVLIAGLALGLRLFNSGVELYYFVAFLWIITVLILLWLGNRYLFNLLDNWLPWSGPTGKRFFTQLLLSCIYSLVCINSTYYLFKVQTSEIPALEQMLVLNVYGLLFIVPVLSINFALYFMNKWKKAHVQSDLLREENLRTQLESLKMQLDPHFLFNNLNVLSSLIELNQEVAQEFLDKFADVYRYVLRYKKEELVPLNVELEFIYSYIFLLKKRFGDQLIFEICVPDDLSDRVCIPPLTLQLLVENAIKHNKISASNPLFLKIFLKDKERLLVQNTLQPKGLEETGMTKTGLENIRKRFSYLSSLKVEVEDDGAYFTVSLPLLEMY
ncbi:sensor histidine kinase [Desertivirga brevis]|uniref:sensor histidine kinase n=1 Tax=Desertivirga brevis TaxID=2810310 RepID=UPI001A96791C|nr:histidine kinase [Pedobacter sp. SYSU D00873]